MASIQTYVDFQAEKEKLETSLRFHRSLMRHDLAALREEFRPVTHALSFIGKLTTRNKSNPVVALSVDVAGDVLLKKIVLEKSGWLTRLIVPFVAKNYATHLLTRQSNKFFQRLAKKLKG